MFVPEGNCRHLAGCFLPVQARLSDESAEIGINQITLGFAAFDADSTGIMEPGKRESAAKSVDSPEYSASAGGAFVAIAMVPHACFPFPVAVLRPGPGVPVGRGRDFSPAVPNPVPAPRLDHSLQVSRGCGSPEYSVSAARALVDIATARRPSGRLAIEGSLA